MQDIFSKRLQNWESEGELTAFNLACVAEALDAVKGMNEQNVGWEQVEERLGEFKSWDPDIFKVDKDTENGYWKRLDERGGPFVFLSEEAGRVDINADDPGEKLYVVCDPFDGSYLFKHGIPDFWYSSLALYGPDLKARSCAVGDCVARKIAFANDTGAFIADLEGDRLERKVRLDKKYREAMGRPDVTQMEGASIESYAICPSSTSTETSFFPSSSTFPTGGPTGSSTWPRGRSTATSAVDSPTWTSSPGSTSPNRQGQ
jgi:fructose-1,6-bisphosphatase/inositol monophosphatase family enzyme